MPASVVTPVTVLTGFLGSGKTTLLNALLADARFADTAVVMNEWGEVAVDHHLVREAAGDVVLLPAGCVCCRVSGDLVRALRELHFQRAEGRVPAFRRVIVETTGLADPGPLLASLVQMPLASVRYALGAVIATVDAVRGPAVLDAHPEAVRQVAMADRLVATHADEASPAAMQALEARLAALNPAAPLARSPGLDPGWILEGGLHRGDRAPDGAGWLSAGEWRHAVAASRHDPQIASIAWRAEEPLAWDDVESALEALLALYGDRLLRLKGLVEVAGEPGPRAVHAVGHTLYPSTRLAAWPAGERGTRLAIIGRGLEEAEVAAILESFRAPANP